MRRLYADMSPGIGWNGREPAALEAATATQATSRTVNSFLATGTEVLAEYPRPIAILVAGTTPAHAPATATITGTDENDDVLVVVLSLLIPTARTRGAAVTEDVFKTVDTIVFAAGSGIGATTSIGFGLIPGVGDLRMIGIEYWLEGFPDRSRPGHLDTRAINDIVRGGSSKVDGAVGSPNGNYAVPFDVPPPPEVARIARDFCFAEAGKLKPNVFQVDHEALRKDAQRDLDALRKAIAGIGEAPPDPAANVGGAVGAIGCNAPYVPPKSFTSNLGDFA
jgi:hypothetical protein